MGFMTANDLTLHFKREGLRQGQTLVFINSLGSDLRIWDEVVPALTDQYDVMRYDLRGHGLSDCPDAPYRISDHTADLNGMLQSLGIEQVVLIGISVGGMIAMDFTSRHPDKVKALIVCDTFPKIGTAEMWNERIDTLRQHGMDDLGETILARWFAPSYKEKHPADYHGYYNMLTRMPVTGYTATCEAIRDADLTDAVRDIQQPTLVICGGEDASTPPELVRTLPDLLPDARYVEIEDAGHLPCVENSRATGAAIKSFLEDVL